MGANPQFCGLNLKKNKKFPLSSSMKLFIKNEFQFTQLVKLRVVE